MSSSDTATGTATEPVDELAASQVRIARGLLGRFNAEEVLDASDVHVALRAGSVTGEQDEDVLLALALAVRALRAGSTCLDLTTVASEVPTYAVPPDWAQRIGASLLAADPPILRTEGDLVFLDRYWREEVQVCDDFLARIERPVDPVKPGLLQAGLDRLFPATGWDEQRAATAIAVAQGTTVLTGGPGTGKTSTVAAVLALLAEQREAAGARPLRIALTAPTGKAAARLNESVASTMTNWGTAGEADRARLGNLVPMTLHRLLGSRPDTATRFRHSRKNRLAHDVVVVDESSMLSLTMMARLLEALRPETRLILVGDPFQLASIDAGAVLSDLVAGLEGRTDIKIAALRTSHRFGPAIGGLAEAIRVGDEDATLEILRSGHKGVEFVEDDDVAQALRTRLVRTALDLRAAATEGRVADALGHLDGHRLLCAHREGSRGVNWWNQQVERWVSEETGDPLWEEWYAGRPILVTSNDYGLGIFNGDTGVTVLNQAGELRVHIRTATGERDFAPSRLAEVQTLHAMTIHKAQGSQSTAVTVLMPDEESRLLTRELFYTALTRAEERVSVVGSEDVVRGALQRQARRASGLRERITPAALSGAVLSGCGDGGGAVAGNPAGGEGTLNSDHPFDGKSNP